MAWNVGNIQEQVQLMTGRNGLNTLVLTWANRVLMEIATMAFWQKQTAVFNQPTDAGATNATTVTSQWVSLSTASASNPIAILQAEVVQGAAATFVAPMVRHEPQELYSYRHGLNVTVSSNVPDSYAVVEWVSATSGATTQNWIVPKVAFHPNVSTNNTNSVNLSWHMLVAPDILTSSTGTGGGESLWIMQQYFHVVLAGVLRYAMIHIGDFNRYMLSKAEYENGKKDMIMNEHTSLASTPIRRGMFSESYYREMQGGN